MKIYFISYDSDDFIIHAYDGVAKVVDSRDDYYKLEGYKSCLSDFGYSYGGDFIDEEKYKYSKESLT